MLRAVHEVLCATRRNPILLGVVATVVPLLVILMLLEISYREEVAREVSLALTGSLASIPTADPPDRTRWTPLPEPIVSIAPPSLAAVEQPILSEPTQRPIQGAIVSRDPVPLPLSRPNRF